MTEVKLQDKQLLGVARTSVRTTYDFQKLRIQMGNRICIQFKNKIGEDHPNATSEELQKIKDDIMARLQTSHTRITDGIVSVHGELTRHRLEKAFKGDDLIGNVAEFFLVDSYVRTLKTEEEHFKSLKGLVEEFPIYTEWLKHQPGIGPAIAAILISEIDIHVATYPSSLHAYAGLDVVQAVKYVDHDGKEKIISFERLETDHRFNIGAGGNITFEGVECTVVGVGRNRTDVCMRTVHYTNRQGEPATRRSLTFSPFLKTKLLGVLGPSLLKSACWRVNDERMSVSRRLELAKKNGFVDKNIPKESLPTAINAYLRSCGYRVDRAGSPYAHTYWEYRHRLENTPRHQEKTPIARHFMANRYMVKMFLIDLYKNWRALEGLPVMPSYAEAKLGIVHGEASPGKIVTSDSAIKRGGQMPSDLLDIEPM